VNKTIEELERICKKIQLKKQIKLFFYLFCSTTILIGFAYYILYGKIQDIKKVEKPRVKVTKIKKQNNPKKIVHTKVTTIQKIDKNKQDTSKINTVIKNKISIVNDANKSEKTNLTGNSNSNLCFTIQYLTAINIKNILRLKKRLKLYKIEQCYTLLPKDNNGFYILRCGMYDSIEKLRKYEKIAKSKNLSFIIKRVKCDYSKILKAEHPKVHKIIPKPIMAKKVNNLIETKTYDIKELEKIYNQNKSYNIAIKIAQLYYKNKKYDSSLKWAKIANILNKKDDKSWIIYAKSLYAKGDVKSAKKILHIYLRFSSSKSVKNLLKKWGQ